MQRLLPKRRQPLFFDAGQGNGFRALLKNVISNEPAGECAEGVRRNLIRLA